MRILIIDDDKLIRMTCCNILRKEGYTVLEAENGYVGLAVFKTEQPDLVITDILMPHKEGLETISNIRAINPKVKIIAITGGGGIRNMDFLQMAKKNFLEIAEEIGADRVLKKPFKPTQIVAVVKSLLEDTDCPAIESSQSPES